MTARIDRATMAIVKKIIEPIAPEDNVTTLLAAFPAPFPAPPPPVVFAEVDAVTVTVGVRVRDGVIDALVGTDGLAPVEREAVGVADSVGD